jgi:hypothetical protein
MEAAVGLDSSEIRPTISLVHLNSSSQGNLLLTVDAPNRNTESNLLTDMEEELSKDLLADSVDSTTYRILCVVGFVWRDPNSIPNVLRNIWNCVALLTVFNPMFFVVDFAQLTRQSIWGVLMFAVFVQSVGVGMCTYLNVCRLRNRYIGDEPSIFCSAGRVTWISISVAAIGTVLLPVIADLAHSRPMYFILEVFPSVVISGINIQFIILDSNHARCLVLHLVNMARTGEQLSMEEINRVCCSINRIVNKSFHATTAIMLAALTNLLCIFVLAIFLHRSGMLMVVYLSCIFLFKEIVFAVVGLYYAAYVNESVAELTIIMGNKLRLANMSSSADSRQISLALQSLQACPIKFPIVGMVLTRKDVAVRIGLWAFSVALSLFTKIAR